MSKTEYNTLHVWVLRHYKKTGKCIHCKKQKKTQWANRSGNYDRENRRDWLELCAQCHSAYDYKHPNMNLGAKKCRYCRGWYKQTRVFYDKRYTVNGIRLRDKEIVLCKDCYRFEQFTQRLYMLRQYLYMIMPLY